jgi:hypothetical protein
MITERTLKIWRRNALCFVRRDSEVHRNLDNMDTVDSLYENIESLNHQVLRLTQELLDQKLIRKGI